MATRKPSLGFSDHYAILRIGKVMFYYGYEYTVPETPEEDQDSDWAFVVKVGKEILVRWSKKDVEKRINENSKSELWGPESVLLAGIGAWLREQEIEALND